MFKKHDVTLYCRYLDNDREERMSRVSLFGVVVDKGMSRNVRNTGSTDAGKVTFYICKNVASTKPYAKPKQFSKQPLTSYTFKTGDKIVIGDVGSEQTIPAELHFILDDSLERESVRGINQALEKLYDDVFTIDEVYEYDFGGLSHFEVRCK